MKRIALLAGSFYPDITPTGKVAIQYSDLLKEEFDITIIFIQSGKERINGIKHKGVTLHAIFNTRLYFEAYFIEKERKSKHKIFRQLFSYLVKVTKAIGRLNAWFIFPRSKCYLLWPGNITWFYPRAYRELIKIHKEQKLDFVFTFNSPFPAHLAGRRFKRKHPGVKWITYTVDPFTRAMSFTKTIIFPKLREQINFNEEKSIYDLADYSFVSEEVFDTDRPLFSKALHKTKPLPYVLQPINRISKLSVFPIDKINLIYSGSFYKSIRNPEYLLKTFLSIRNPDILLHLFIYSDCEDLINYYIDQSNGRIIRHTMVGHDAIINILLGSDILISVGNSTSAFKPSKIFEYISTGKPIVHFYQNGLNDDVLSKYPFALQINQNEANPATNATMVERFCIKFKDSRLDADEIAALYPNNMPEQIYKTLIKAFN